MKKRAFEKKFAATKDALQLLDLTKTETRTFTVFSKDKLRSYLKNPLSNANNLRALSRFLYRLSFQYRRLVNYNAKMIDLAAQVIIPLINLTEDPNPDDVLKKYNDTLLKMEQMDLVNEIFKLLVVAWREDTVYGYVYDDDDSFFIHILDGDFCTVSSIQDGILNFAFDFSYFRSHEADLEYWDSEFQKKYNAYMSDTSLKWQELDPTRTICLKVNIDDPTLPLPPFLAIFEQIIDLIDLQSIQSVKDELSIYKLLVARLETLQNADEPDDFSVDIDTAIEYYEKLAEALPDSVSCVLSPIKIDSVEFKGNSTEDVDMISNSMNNLFTNSGGSQILNSKNLTGSSAFEASTLCDSEMAIASLLPQIQKWTNRYLDFTIGDDHAKVHYMEVSPYLRSKKKKELLESAQNGVPVKLALAALDGFTPLETLSMEYLENQVLQLHNSWVPLSTSYTQSSSDTDPVNGGAPKKDELTPEGEKTREKEKNK